MDYKEAIEVIKKNYPPENYTMLREALDLAMNALEAWIKLSTDVFKASLENGEDEEWDSSEESQTDC